MSLCRHGSRVETESNVPSSLFHWWCYVKLCWWREAPLYLLMCGVWWCLVVLVVTMRQWTHSVPPRRAAAAAARLSSQWAGAAAATNIFTLATRYFCARSYRAVVDRVQLILKLMGIGAETSNLANACR